ncbi:MAG TPA: SUMF1/EgtB/PvdO family nonheme iron enzyme, partial [Solirubrobacteraceae bacterium]|nr:SUMF1/EgtB/PvdO family nonheme iron enzyme [Solirubrobacteraceae bacterium]
MPVDPSASAAGRVEIGAVIAELERARERTLALVAHLPDAEIERVQSPIMSPLAWDLAHIAAYEDLWLAHRHGGLELLRADLAERYDAFETPRSVRGEIELLSAAEAREYMREVRARVAETLPHVGTSDGVVCEMVIRHELQHTETMRQTLALAGLLPHGEPALEPMRAEQEWVRVPAGEFALGAEGTGFAYDNERPRHRTDVRGYLIGRTPVTNATYLTFVEGGGYERREWWSDEGWAWKEEYDITHPAAWTADRSAEWRLGTLEPLHPHRPVVHVSWFEADAFARSHGARLPTEVEWEKAATWDQETGTARRFPWGREIPVPGLHANVDQLAGGPVAADAFPAGSSPYG